MIVYEKILMTLILKMTTKNQLRQFEHMQRRPLKALVRRVDYMIFSHLKKNRGRLKRLLEKINKRLFNE